MEYYGIVDEMEGNFCRFDMFRCDDLMNMLAAPSFLLEVSQPLSVADDVWYKITLGDGDGIPAKLFDDILSEQHTDVTIIDICLPLPKVTAILEKIF